MYKEDATLRSKAGGCRIFRLRQVSGKDLVSREVADGLLLGIASAPAGCPRQRNDMVEQRRSYFYLESPSPLTINRF